MAKRGASQGLQKKTTQGWSVLFPRGVGNSLKGEREHRTQKTGPFTSIGTLHGEGEKKKGKPQECKGKKKNFGVCVGWRA